jgi:hypothetical protein
MTTKSRHKPSYTGLQQARERAASELGLPLSDWRVERLAKLVIADEAMQSLLVVAPERVDFGKMLDIDRALADLRKELGVTKPMELWSGWRPIAGAPMSRSISPTVISSDGRICGRRSPPISEWKSGPGNILS